MTDTDTRPQCGRCGEPVEQTWTVIVHGLGFWGCGNSYWEAVRNAKKHGRGFDHATEYHRIFYTSKPVKEVTGSFMGVSWAWADGVAGTFKTRDKNDKES